MIKILLSIALAVAVTWGVYQHRIIVEKERELRIVQNELTKKYIYALRERDNALALAQIMEDEWALAQAPPPISAPNRLSSDKRPFGNRILMDTDPRSERANLPQRKN